MESENLKDVLESLMPGIKKFPFQFKELFNIGQPVLLGLPIQNEDGSFSFVAPDGVCLNLAEPCNPAGTFTDLHTGKEYKYTEAKAQPTKVTLKCPDFSVEAID